MKTFKNKTIWITGASDGIGKALAIQLAEQGAQLILTARRVEKLSALKETLNGSGHLVVPMDLLEVSKIPHIVKDVMSKVGNIDVLINNAGLSQRSLVKDTLLDVDRKLMELNYFAVVALTKAVLPSMRVAKNGLLVTISSVAGKVGTPMRSGYCGAKHAVIGFMDAVRAEVAKDNVAVMVVTPGSIATNISINALEGDGNTHNVVDPMIAKGIPVETCAKTIVNAMQKGTKELLLGSPKEKLAVYLRRFYPNLLFKLMTRLQSH